MINAISILFTTEIHINGEIVKRRAKTIILVKTTSHFHVPFLEIHKTGFKTVFWDQKYSSYKNIICSKKVQIHLPLQIAQIAQI